VIQELLRDADASDVGPGLVSVDGVGPEAEAAWSDLESPETYLGYERSRDFASPGGIAPKERHIYVAPERLGTNHWALTGDWTVDSESAVSNEPAGRIEFAFHARDVHLVMGRGTGIIRAHSEAPKDDLEQRIGEDTFILRKGRRECRAPVIRSTAWAS
jgi:hypothetical protein